jgi:dUTP pyrophosphatase
MCVGLSLKIFINILKPFAYIKIINMKLNVIKLKENATLPKYGSEWAAGLDITSTIDVAVLPRNRMLIPTGISVSWDDPNFYLRVAPRSGLSVKNSIDIGAGVIDFDYRGEIYVCFINNHSHDAYNIKMGDRIAQLIPTRTQRFDTISEVDEHTKTERGDGGFGSTGI